MEKNRKFPPQWRKKWKGVLIMSRMTLFFMLAFNLTLHAGVFSQSLTLRMKNVTLEEVLLEIQKGGTYDIICNSRQIGEVKNISLDVKDVKVEEVLKLCLKGTLLGYELMDNTIVIYEAGRKAQPREEERVVLQGVVKGDDGKPLPGAAVYLKGKMMLGTVTNIDGEFRLSVPAGMIGKETLVVSFVGMRTYEHVLVREAYAVTLKSEITQLNDVVVTGYQTLSRERATGAFAVVNSKMLDQKLQPDIMSRMEGMAAGMTNYKGGLKIRGTSTLAGVSTPLYVVDGVPYEGTLDAINPSEIASITVLKDATAASIYGARSANGVIVIQTKRGAVKSTIEYTGTVVIKPLRDNRDYLNLMDSRELVDWQVDQFNHYHDAYASMNKKYYINEVKELLYRHEAGELTEGALEEKLEVYRNRNNYDEIRDRFMRTAITHQHNLALRGGADRYQYSASVNYTKNLLELQGQDNDRIGFNLRSNFQFFDWLKADMGVVGSYTKASYDDGLKSDDGLYNIDDYLYGRRSSYQTLFDENGNQLNWYQDKSQSEMDRLLGVGLYDESYYPLEEIHRKTYLEKSNYVNVNMALNVKIIEGLNVDLRYQLEKRNGMVQNYTDQKAYSMRTRINNSTKILSNGSFEHLIPEGGYINERRDDMNSYTLRAQINFNRTFDDIHDVSAIAGGERRAVHSTSTYLEKWGYDPVSLSHKYIDEASLNDMQMGTQAPMGAYIHFRSQPKNTFGDKEDRYVSFYGNASYTYDGRYSITGSVRMDQSNLFGTDPKYQYRPLWSAGVSWYLAKESFMKEFHWLDQLSLRLTKGINGNIAKTSGPYMIVESAGMNSWTGEYASAVSTPPNSGLRWERTNQTNMGLDFSFFGNRLAGSVDYYIKNTSDLLGSREVDPTSGWSSLEMNYAKMYNHGYEISLNTINLQRKDFSWETNINFSYNKNRITKLENSSNSVAGYLESTNTREGMALGTLFSVRWAGLDDEGRPQAYKKDSTIVKSLKDLETDDLVRSGTSVPRYAASMSNMLKWKGFNLSFMFQYYGGHVMRDAMATYYTNTNGTVNVNRNIMNYWKSPEDSNKPDVSPAFLRNASNDIQYLWYGADKHIRKANYIKLREVTLSYAFPKQLLAKIGVSGLSLNAQILNVWWWGSQKRRLNPEAWEGTRISYSKPARMALDPTVYTLGLSLNI